MNLLSKLLASARVGDVLDFGVLENIILKDVTNEKQIRDEQEVQRNCYMRFQRANEKGVIYQESQFSFFNIDPDKEKRPSERLLTQLQQLSEIATAIDEKCGKEFGIASFEVIKSEENFMKKARSKKVAEFQNEISDVFVTTVKPYLEAQPKVRLKVVTSWDGQYTNLPDSVPMIESMDIEKKDSVLAISHQEMTNSKKAPKAATGGEATPESNGQAPKKNAVLADL